jgi:hypothetical protein
VRELVNYLVSRLEERAKKATINRELSGLKNAASTLSDYHRSPLKGNVSAMKDVQDARQTPGN